jgi:hypothetical protein
MALVKGNARSSSALDATVLTGNLPAISGASLTGVSAGKVLQFKKVSSGAWDAASGNWNITSSTLTSTGRTVTITPTAANSLIVGTGFITYGADVSSISHFQFGFSLRRDSGSPSNADTEVTGGTPNNSYLDSEFNGSQQTRYDVYRYTDIQLYDSSHNTTSQITYRLYVKSSGAASHQTRGGMLYLNLYEIEQ